VELINHRDGFYCVGCVCGLGGVYVGVWFVLHQAGFFKEPGSTTPQVMGFFK
jgi:hypothetical protein